MLEAITDYASISLVNARLFRALAQNADAALAGERRKNELLQTLRQETQVQLQTAAYPLELVLTEKMGALTAEQTQALSTAQAALKKLAFLINQQSTQPQQNIK